MAEVITCLRKSIAMAEQAGIKRENIIIDPGIGFGKTWHRISKSSDACGNYRY